MVKHKHQMQEIKPCPCVKRESFDECVFTEYYSGDIREYAKAEIIRLTDFSAAITAEDFKTRTERFERALEPYLRDCSATVGVMAEDHEGDASLDICVFPGGNPDARACGIITLGEGIRWLENVYIEATPGVRVTSGIYDLVLVPGSFFLFLSSAAPFSRS